VGDRTVTHNTFSPIFREIASSAAIHREQHPDSTHTTTSERADISSDLLFDLLTRTT